MNRSFVSSSSLRRSHVGSVGRLRGLVFNSTPWCAVSLSEGSYKVPVCSFVSGCGIASVTGSHLGIERKDMCSLILQALYIYSYIKQSFRMKTTNKSTATHF